VAGGLGQYLGIDPVYVRLFFIVLALATGWGVLLYLVLCIVLPETSAFEGEAEDAGGCRRLDARERSLLFGGTLVALGLLLLARELRVFWWLGLHRFWPVLLIAAGIVLLFNRTRGVRW
jgi:phage shock protein PspC (stress-responsive transcriptional regulator)